MSRCFDEDEMCVLVSPSGESPVVHVKDHKPAGDSQVDYYKLYVLNSE